MYAVHRFHIAVHVGALDVDFRQIVGKFFGHALGKRGNEYTLTVVDSNLYLVDEVVDLT